MTPGARLGPVGRPVPSRRSRRALPVRLALRAHVGTEDGTQ